MIRKSKIKIIQQNTQRLKRVVFSCILFPRFARNKRAVSAVVSNLILIGAVITIGLFALAYARSNAISYQTDYAHTMNSDISKLKETLTFEYAHYDSTSHKLYVYVLNSGSTTVNITHVSVNALTAVYSIHPISDHDQTHPISGQTIDKGQEGYVFSIINLAPGSYTIKLTVGSGATFVYNILV